MYMYLWFFNRVIYSKPFTNYLYKAHMYMYTNTVVDLVKFNEVHVLYIVVLSLSPIRIL